MKPNPHFFECFNPFLKYIPVASEQSGFNRFRTGELDVIASFPAGKLEGLRTSKDQGAQDVQFAVDDVSGFQHHQRTDSALKDPSAFTRALINAYSPKKCYETAMNRHSASFPDSCPIIRPRKYLTRTSQNWRDSLKPKIY